MCIGDMEDPFESSALSHGILMFFCIKLNHISISKEANKQVDATIDLLYTVVKGHWVACACDALDISNADSQVNLPRGICEADG